MKALNRQFSPARQLPRRFCGHRLQPGLQPGRARYFHITLLMMSLVFYTSQAFACCEENPPRAGAPDNTSESEVKSEPSVVALVTKTPVSAAQNDIHSVAAARLASEVESSYVKISASGDVLAENTITWECVEDRNSKLIWEVKKNDGSVRDRDYSYSWFDKKDGARNGGRCEGDIDCDTYSYVQAMNASKLCGFSDWRLPTRTELETLVEYNNNPEHATINRTYFPEAVASWYWTASEHPQINSYAWYVLFQNGRALNDLKERPKHIRLVRGSAVQ